MWFAIREELKDAKTAVTCLMPAQQIQFLSATI
jgi:hypothetical protein